MTDIVLASASPRRAELLRGLGVPFRILPSDGEEHMPNAAPDAVVLSLSRQKAEAVAPRAPDSVVIAADTVVYCERILGKPKGEREAFEMLSLLSGRAHSVYTGVTVARGAELRAEVCRTDVFFRSLSEEEIRRYLATGEPYDKAGGYGIQGKGALFVDRIEGDYFNVVGLPVRMLYGMLLEYGIDLMQFS